MLNESKNNHIYKKQVTQSFVVSVTLCMTILFFAPINFFYMNIQQLPYYVLDVLVLSLKWLSVSIVFLTLILTALRPSLHKKAIVFVFMMAFLFWVQGNILNWNYNIVFDGRPMDWSKYIMPGIIDLIVWSFFLIVAFLKSLTVYNNIRFFCYAVIVVQAISLSFIIFQSPKEHDWKNYQIDSSGKLEFSNEKNVIVIILDNFQSDFFQLISAEDQAYKNIFDGFTYFRNSLGSFPGTYPSIPVILTSQRYDNSLPIREFYKKAYNSDASVPFVLRENSFDVELYPLNNQVYYTINPDPKIISNLVNVNKVVTNNDAFFIFNRALFRYLPQLAKEYMLNSLIYKLPTANSEIQKDLEYTLKDGVFSMQDLAFMHEVMEKGLTVTSDYNSFKFFHLWGAHPPYRLNENMTIENMMNGSESYIRQAKASLKIVEKFLNALKESGIYDNSLIFVVGDHGTGSFRVNELPTFNVDFSPTVNYSVSELLIASGLPLILAKPFGSIGEMQISDAPVALEDIPYTIFNSLNINNDMLGISLFERSENDVRKRYYFHHDRSNESWDSKYYAPLNEYMVNGHSWIQDSWKPTFRTFTPDGVIDKLGEVEKSANNFFLSPENHSILSTKNVDVVDGVIQFKNTGQLIISDLKDGYNDYLEIGLTFQVNAFHENNWLFRKFGPGWPNNVSFTFGFQSTNTHLILSNNGIDTDGIWLPADYFKIGVPYELVMIFNQGNLELYINNELAVKKSLKFEKLYTSTLPIIVGDKFDGTMKNFYIINRPKI